MNVIAFITLIFLFIYQVTASDYHECDRLAGSPDSYENGIGMPMEKLNADIAIKACLDAIKQYPELSRFKTAIARAYTKEGDVDKAIEFYQLAIKKNANDKVALNNLASLLFKKDKITSSIEIKKTKSINNVGIAIKYLIK